jgi:hypothetical protein
MDIGAKLAQIEQRLKAIERQSRLGSASIDDTAIEVRDGSGSLRALFGQQSDGTTAVNVVNGSPPPAPTTPTVSAALGGIAVGWDGTFTAGALIPLDWSRVEVHTADLDDFTPLPETLQATIETPQGGIVYIPTTTPLYVRLVARNTSGTASTPTDTVGPYEPRPISDDIGPGGITETLIADGAITTPKVYANAITTALLAAGSVDATALKADAITGKTITGGTINGAEFHSDNGAGGLVDIEDGTIEATGPDGWRIKINPTLSPPVITFFDAAGDVAGQINASSESGEPCLNISSGPFTDGAVTDWSWTTVIGTDEAANGWTTKRVRRSDVNTIKGGYLDLTNSSAGIGFVDSTDADPTASLRVSLGLAFLDEARLVLDPPATSNSALYVGAKTGHTGHLIRALLNGADRFTVSPSGAVTATGAVNAAGFDTTGAVSAASVTATGAVNGASVTATGAVTGGSLSTTGTASAGELAVTGTTWQTYTPTVANAGTAVFAIRDGWYFKIGKLVYFEAYITCSAAGSGTTGITVSLPSTPYRGIGGNTRRQYVGVYAGGIAAGTNSSIGGHAVGLIQPTATGAQLDQVRGPTDILVRGENLSATATLTINGWYREA